MANSMEDWALLLSLKTRSSLSRANLTSTQRGGVPAGPAVDRKGSVYLRTLAAWISGLPLVDHAAARSGLSKYTWSGVRPPSAGCGLTAL